MKILNKNEYIITTLSDVIKYVNSEHKKLLNEIINYHTRIDLVDKKENLDSIIPTDKEIESIKRRFSNIAANRLYKSLSLPNFDAYSCCDKQPYDIWKNFDKHNYIESTYYIKVINGNDIYDEFKSDRLDEIRYKYNAIKEKLKHELYMLAYNYTLDIDYIKRKVYINRYLKSRGKTLEMCAFSRDATSHINDMFFHSFEINNQIKINEILTKIKESYETAKQQIATLICV